MAVSHAHVWKVDTENGETEERRAERVAGEEVRNPLTRAQGCRLDLSMLPIKEDSFYSSYFFRDVHDYNPLTVLDITDCGLNTFPHFILSAVNLVRLRLTSNNLKTLPDAIGNLGYLERLSVYGNQLESLPWTLYKLHRLTIFRLGGNNLRNDDLHAIQQMAGLQHLYLRQNYKLTSIPRDVCLMRSLRELNADECDNLRSPPLGVIKQGMSNLRSYYQHSGWY
ncbi:leucine-rich repeat-containing protein 40-like [Corticium candelabrum]|uniref:leucine-rich repeat-containing protein 40-like n=1 Tax=Corticium candelabrum TaxID=121492 RepID=UPI002E25F2D2|nr:leucine-rich repeat-containing protein 40-like [Corticium candelabrum]